MSTRFEKQKRLHHDVTNVGLRAQATAVGLIQLCIELRRAEVLDDTAIRRIKAAIGDELAYGPHRRVASRDQRSEIDERLDRIFAGEQRLGPAGELAGVNYISDEEE